MMNSYVLCKNILSYFWNRSKSNLENKNMISLYMYATLRYESLSVQYHIKKKEIQFTFMIQNHYTHWNIQWFNKDLFYNFGFLKSHHFPFVKIKILSHNVCTLFNVFLGIKIHHDYQLLIFYARLLLRL